MSFRSGRGWLWVLLGLWASGCGACLSDLSGTRCNPDSTCGPGYLCSSADVCVAESACAGGTCHGRCLDFSQDPSNCGVCGNVCPPGVACTQGTCACPRGLIACAAQCVDPSADPQHCDACEDTCGPTAPVCGRSRCLDPSWSLWPMPPSPSYTSTQDISVDAVTGLSWERTPPSGTLSQADASARCAGLALGGFTDWRLPSRIELVSLLRPELTPALDAQAFPGAPGGPYWSSSPAAQAPGEAWAVNFTAGDTLPLGTATLASVRCVR